MNITRNMRQRCNHITWRQTESTIISCRLVLILKWYAREKHVTESTIISHGDRQRFDHIMSTFRRKIKKQKM